MTNYIIINITRDSYNNDSINENNSKKFTTALKSLDKYFNEKGIQFRFNFCQSMRWVTYDSIVNICSTYDIPAQDKTLIIDTIKVFLTDGDAFQTRPRQHQIPFTVVFHKINTDDIIEVDA